MGAVTEAEVGLRGGARREGGGVKEALEGAGDKGGSERKVRRGSIGEAGRAIDDCCVWQVNLQ